MEKQLKGLGNIVKAARERSDITIENLAYKVGITERYLYRIENEEKKPSFDLTVPQPFSRSIPTVFP